MFDHSGRPAGSIGVVGPEERLHPDGASSSLVTAKAAPASPPWTIPITRVPLMVARATDVNRATSLFSASGSVTVMFNTTLQEQSFVIPDSFLPLLEPGDP